MSDAAVSTPSAGPARPPRSLDGRPYLGRCDWCQRPIYSHRSDAYHCSRPCYDADRKARRLFAEQHARIALEWRRTRGREQPAKRINTGPTRTRFADVTNSLDAYIRAETRRKRAARAIADAEIAAGVIRTGGDAGRALAVYPTSAADWTRAVAAIATAESAESATGALDHHYRITGRNAPARAALGVVLVDGRRVAAWFDMGPDQERTAP